MYYDSCPIQKIENLRVALHHDKAETALAQAGKGPVLRT
jgi:hypothetical protein